MNIQIIHRVFDFFLKLNFDSVPVKSRLIFVRWVNGTNSATKIANTINGADF